MASMSNNMNISEEKIDDYTFFMTELQNEVFGDKFSHFLRVSGVNRAFLEGDYPSDAEGTWGCTKANRHMLQTAIWEFYRDFDREKYETFVLPKGVFTKCVWGKYRDLHREWNVLHESHRKNISEEASRKLLVQRKGAHLKRQAKALQQMLVLGGGDMALGRQKFVERMHVQKEVKRSKVNDVSLQLEEAFTAWLVTPEAKSYLVHIIHEKVLRDHAAQKRGLTRLMSRRKNAWQEESKYGHVCRDIRHVHVSMRKKANFQVDNTDKIMNLCDMFEKGLLNESQFERAKEQLLG